MSDCDFSIFAHEKETDDKIKRNSAITIWSKYCDLV